MFGWRVYHVRDESWMLERLFPFPVVIPPPVRSPNLETGNCIVPPPQLEKFTQLKKWSESRVNRKLCKRPWALLLAIIFSKLETKCEKSQSSSLFVILVKILNFRQF